MKMHYETKRLVLKVLDDSNAHVVLDHALRNRDFLKELEPLKPKDYYTIEFQKNLLLKEYEETFRGNFLKLYIFKKEDEGCEKTIGSVSFSNIVRGGFLSCFLGYKLDKDEINRGYMTEAVNKGIDIMFKEYGLHRIEANIMPRNKPSMRVVEKLGFCNEGLSRKYLNINGKWEDHIHMVILNEEMENEF